MIVFQIALDLLQNEFDECVKLSEQTYAICSRLGLDNQLTKESMALFSNNVHRLKALALEQKFKLGKSSIKGGDDASLQICHAIKAAEKACEEMASVKSVHGLALAKFQLGHLLKTYSESLTGNDWLSIS